MQALPSFLLAAVLGFYFGGVQGLAIGAGCGWVLCIIATKVEEKVARRRDEALVGIVKRLNEMQETLRDIAAVTARGTAIQTALLDAAPVEPYDIMEMHTPRTSEEWDVVHRSLWQMIRRRLVVAYGLRADRVDAAKNCLMDQHATQHPLPKSDDALAKMVDGWKESEAWARDFAHGEATTYAQTSE